MTSLNLPESLLLLALNDETGERFVSYVDYALGGAGFAELILRGVLMPSQEKDGRFSWGDKGPTGDAFLDRCRDIIDKTGVGKDPKTLVAAIGKKSGVSQPLIDNLVARGVLHERTKKVFFFFTQKIYPEADPSAERELKARLAQVMFGNGDAGPEDSVLVALAKNMDLLKRNFDKDQLRQHKTRIEAIAKGDQLAATATKAAIDAVHAAIFVTVILPAVIIPTVT